MDTVDAQWVKELQEQIAKGTLYWQLDQQMVTAGCRYEAVRQGLSKEQREILDEFIHLRKQLEICMTRTAYMIGVEHGRKHK